MIISCPECSTRFRVDDHKIPAQGAKIRCARCKHIFAVAPPAPEPEPLIKETPVVPPQPAASAATDDFPAEADDFSTAADDFSAETDDFSPSAESAAAESAKDDSFGFEDEIGAGVNDEFDPTTFEEEEAAEDDDFSYGDDYGNVSIDGTDDLPEEDSFAFGEPAPRDSAATAQDSQGEFRFKEEKAPAPDPLAGTFAEDPSIDDNGLSPADDFAFERSAPEAMPAARSSSRSPLSVVILFVLVLILAVLVAGGILVWKNGPGGLESLISNLTGQPQLTEQQGGIRLTNLQGSFITNRKEGELFVIRGVAINEHKEAQAAIQVKGVIYDKSGKQILQKTIFCGNPISDADLRKLSYSKMEEMMGNQFGESLANLNVTPGQSIPFTIVFHKLPKTLSEFVVEVADSKPAAQ